MSGSTANPIVHKGYIENITDHSVIVRIVSEAACAACHAKSACNMAERQDKEIEVEGTYKTFAPGETVDLVMAQSQGYRAVLIGYGYPFIIIFAGLILFSALGLRETLSGLLSIVLLIPYYLAVYLFRNNIRKNFTFSIRKSE